LLAGSGYFLLVALAFLVGLDHLRPSGGAKSNDWTAFDHQQFIVSRVVDGDTIHIQRQGSSGETIVRLLGVDAPEMHDPTTGRPAHWAERAKSYVQARADRKNVTIVLEPIETRDRYGRLLAYVYLSDNDCLNIDLVHDGQAYADRRFPHSYHSQYAQAENDARRKQRGLWKGVTEDMMPAWRRAWLHELNRDR
jgi:micrococcal nuclease